MSLDPLVVGTIALMALATAATRLSGLWLAARLPAEGRARAALEAVPAAVLTALVAPTVLLGGPAELVAGIAAALAAWRLPLVAVVAIGAGTVALLRAALG